MVLVQARARWGSTAVAVLRGVLVVLLLGGGAMAVRYEMPDDGSLVRFYEDVRDHRVDRIEYDYRVDDGTYDLDVRWSTGPLSWWEYSRGGSVRPISKELKEAFPDEYSGPQGVDFEADLRRVMGSQKIDIRPHIRERGDSKLWVSDMPDGWPRWTVLAGMLGLFVVMLRRRDHGYANRWAWFWLFLSSPLGGVGHLLLERRPVPPGMKALVGGVAGFFGAIALGILFQMAVVLGAWLLT